MNRISLKLFVLSLAAAAFVASPLALAHSGSPAAVTWSNGQTLTTADLNNTVAHIHNTFSAGIVDAHISTAAAIAHSKMATPGLIPKAAVSVAGACAGSGSAACTILANLGGVASVTGAGTSAGQYNVNLNYTPAANSIVALATRTDGTGTCSVSVLGVTAPQVRVFCLTSAGAAGDAPFAVTVYSN